jgi:hypothetical protein
LDSLLRFRPGQRLLKGVEGIEEPVGGWQRNLIDEILCRRDGSPVEGGDSAREDIDKAVQLRIRKRSIDVSVSGCGVAVEVIRAENDLERAAFQTWTASSLALGPCESLLVDLQLPDLRFQRRSRDPELGRRPIGTGHLATASRQGRFDQSSLLAQ